MEIYMTLTKKLLKAAIRLVSKTLCEPAFQNRLKKYFSGKKNTETPERRFFLISYHYLFIFLNKGRCFYNSLF